MVVKTAVKSTQKREAVMQPAAMQEDALAETISRTNIPEGTYNPELLVILQSNPNEKIDLLRMAQDAAGIEAQAATPFFERSTGYKTEKIRIFPYIKRIGDDGINDPEAGFAYLGAGSKNEIFLNYYCGINATNHEQYHRFRHQKFPVLAVSQAVFTELKPAEKERLIDSIEEGAANLFAAAAYAELTKPADRIDSVVLAMNGSASLGLAIGLYDAISSRSAGILKYVSDGQQKSGKDKRTDVHDLGNALFLLKYMSQGYDYAGIIREHFNSNDNLGIAERLAETVREDRLKGGRLRKELEKLKAQTKEKELAMGHLRLVGS